MPTESQRPDGSWESAKPLPPRGLVARVEFRLRRAGFRRTAALLGRWDERGLG